jgi:hypothetical protein
MWLSATIHLSFANQEKQTSVFCFRLQQTEVCRFRFPFAENKWKLPFSICGIPEMWRHGHGEIETWRNRQGDMETRRNVDIKKKVKQKPRRFSVICLMFAHRANESLSFVCFLAKKRTEDPFASGQTGHSWSRDNIYLYIYIYIYIFIGGRPNR